MNLQAVSPSLITKISTLILNLSRKTSGQNSFSLKSSSTKNKALPNINLNKNHIKNSPISPKKSHKNLNHNYPKSHHNNNITTLSIFLTFHKQNIRHLRTKNSNNNEDLTHLSNKI